MHFNHVNTVAVHLGDNDIIHVLDIDDRKGQTVTNAIDDLQQPIEDRLSVPLNCVKWLLYGTDGIISEFANGKFKYVDLDDPHVFVEWKDEMLSRQGGM